VSLAPAINPCHGFSFDINDTGDKFITGVYNTGEQLLTVTATPTHKFIAGDKNKDIIEVGYCQGRKSAISLAVDVAHGRQWCHWNHHS
jgi:hypothetical protein